jgi:Ca2+-binding EF-hand superfamily protein
LLKGYNKISGITHDDDITKIFNTIDMDNNGAIDYSEFVSATIDRK